MAQSRKRKKRKVVGARSAKSGRFVKKEKLETAPASTVAVTKQVEAEPKKDDGFDQE